MAEIWHAVLAEADLAIDATHAACMGGWYVLLHRSAAGIHALNDRCTHQAARLSPGRVRRGAVLCPLHGARFDLATGACLGGAYDDLRRFATRVTDGMIEVAVPDTPPGMAELPILV